MTHPPTSGRAIDMRPYGLYLALALGGLLAFRIAALAFNSTNLFFDEAQYWDWGRDLAFGYFSKPPLIAWIVRAVTELCGTSTFCVRLASPLIYTATSYLVYLIAKRLYDARAGFWSAVVFATLPGVSFSAGILSTDVPLLFFWALALYALTVFMERQSWTAALLLGAGLGGGLLAKYAMIYFVLCAGVAFAVLPQLRPLAKSGKLYAGLVLAALLFAPNVWWNFAHGFATLSHTAANAKWGGALFHPNKAAEFLLAQFGVFGPILFGALIVIVVRAMRARLPDADRLLLAFCLPVIALVTVQAFLSRAHANWAATAYVAAAILVTATMIRTRASHWFAASLGVHGLALALITAGNIFARDVVLPGRADPYARVLGWDRVGDLTRRELEKARERQQPYRAILTRDRVMITELLYYLRDQDIPILAWRSGPHPRHHYDMFRPFDVTTPEPILLVTRKGEPVRLLSQFADVTSLGVREVPAGRKKMRRLRFYRLMGYQR